jgi:geranylgeranyl pyrophosphate synthase/uncharacterized protein with NAD-binding domain and iron-sulfur cluster
VPRVVVIGGGIGGLSAAHELAERGFEVVVLERRHSLGGKARSIEVEPTRLGPNPQRVHPRGSVPSWAPGEHGFRFFPGFYRHVVDTMSRTPVASGRTVADSLVPTTRIGITQYGQPMFELSARFPRKPNDAVTMLQALLLAFSPVTGLQPDELAHFGGRIWQILTSCPERRLVEYEKVPWWSFIGAESRSPAYQKFLASGITRSLVAAKARSASTRTIGDIFVQLMLTLVDPLAASTDRVLDGPTSLVWIDAWQHWIESLGVELRTKATVTGIRCDGRRVTGVEVVHDGVTEIVTGDHYVCALPVERFAPLLSPDILEADPGLASIEPLARNVEWMSGLQFYLRRPMPLVHGHVIHIDTEWALTSISQVQFWGRQALDRYTGHPEVKDILSVDVSDWEEAGHLGRPAMACNRLEVALEVWRQLKRSVNDSGAGELHDDDLSAWFMDPDIHPMPNRLAWLSNVEPLLVNLADTWRLRPEAVTSVPNFFLASDYVRTCTDLATMESANEAARRAVNGILEATDYTGEWCSIWPLEEPAALEPLRDYDAARFALGLPWDRSLLDGAAAGVEAASPAVGVVTSLMSGVEPLVTTIEEVKLDLDQAERAAGLGRLEKAVIEPLQELRALTEPVSSMMVPVAGPSVSSPAPDRPAAAEPLAAAAGPVPAADPTAAEAPVSFDSPVGRPEQSDQDTGPRNLTERLEWYRALVASVIQSALPGKEPLEYLYAPMLEFVERPAKGLRGALLLATCCSHGGPRNKALDSAAGLELLHHAFLVHDDIEDGSLYRRGQTTLHRQLGSALAINVGDAINAYAMRMFRRNADQLDPEASLAILDEVDHLLIESLEGQAMELGWVRNNVVDVDEDDYLRMVLKKTAWYSFIHPMRIGALVAGMTEDLDRFNRLGFLLGAAFQIHDDVLNLTGAAGRYGKEIGGDLWEGKRTVVLSHVARHPDPNVRARLTRFLVRRRDERLPREVADMFDLLASTGAIEWAHAAARRLAEAAGQELPVAFREAQNGPDLNFIRSFATYLVDRDT